MRIFICWSRGRSAAMAEALRVWLPSVVEGLEPPFVSSQIEPGQQWFDEISEALRNSQAGLICLTPENVAAPWIHFEAGALATAVNGRIFTYLHRVPPERLTGPLGEFQSTRATREDTLRLVKAIAAAANAGADEAALLERFEREWPALAADIRDLDAIAIDTAVPDFEEQFDSQTFTEPMRECRDQRWSARYERVVRVHTRLSQASDKVSALGLEHLTWLYGELLRHLERYRMGLSSNQLLTPREFDKAPDGLLDIPKDVLDACEDPRIRVQELKERLLSTSSAPVLADAVRFERLPTYQQKEMVEDLERRVAAGETVVAEGDTRRALGSFWDYDRIACYVAREPRVATAEEVLQCAQHVRRELDRVETRRVRSSLKSLYYALRALASGMQRAPLGSAPADVLEVAGNVERYVTADPERDERQKFAQRLAQIRGRRVATAPASPAQSPESTTRA